MATPTIEEITADIQAWGGKGLELSTVAATRHKLTAMINSHLFENTNKDDGRKAVQIRNALDSSIFNMGAEAIGEGSVEGLYALQRAIQLENLSERMSIMEGMSRRANRTGPGMKREMLDLLGDPDRFQHFIPAHQQIFRSGAAGMAFLAHWRFNKIMDSIQQEAAKLSAQVH